MQKRKHARGTKLASFRTAYAVLGLPIICFLAIALAFGGGGSRYALANLFVQLAGVALLAFFVSYSRGKSDSIPRGLLILCGCTLALPLLQVVPLPAAVWQSLPGRDLVSSSLDLIGSESAWFPISVDRGRTFVAFASLLPVVAVLAVFPWGQRDAGYYGLLLLVALGVANFVFGALQLAIPGNAINPYPVLTAGRLYGFFASHNSSGLFFVICLCAAIGAFKSSQRGSGIRTLLTACGFLFIIGAILTNSRSSTALLLLPIALAIWTAIQSLPRDSGKLRLGIAGGIGLIIAGAGGYLLSNTRLGATWERFSSLEDHRPEIWEDSLISAERFWPVGSGMGTFRDVFPVDESLEHVLAGSAGRAHSEYLELAIETGIFGLILVLAWTLWLLWRVFAARSERNWPVVQAAALAALCIFLQGFVDYPLRNQALLCIAGLLIALMVGRETGNKGS